MKICDSCKLDLPLENFCKNRSKPDGLCGTCRTCKSNQDKKYQRKHKDKIKSKKHKYYLDNKDHIVEKTNAWIVKNRVKRRVYSTKAKNKLKEEVFRYYENGSLKCRNCPECDLGILTIDHIDGSGGDHRRKLYGKNQKGGGSKFWQWLKRNNYPEGFQVLCYNCQFRKRMTEMRPENPTATQETRARYARSVKVQCLKEYGGCKCKCGEKDMDVLTLDHVNDDGADHRKETGTRGYNFYIMLRKNGFPKDVPLQTMCLNCQIRKRNLKYEEGKNRQTDNNNGSALAA